ncbi:nucleotidyltransferase substrate binding protein [Lonepinella sp. BR2357]|uniref:nucleotidyltransferase substrate binding protein n=1 Tax=Lonepinella sp. BR2357 TaxID=3434549 RepID=UPI003F6E0BA7
MNDITLDFTPLINAVERLKEGLARYQADVTDIQIRDGLIQRFEFTYELSHKMLKRYLVHISPNPAQYDAMPFQDLIRSGYEMNLLQGEWKDWKTYREMRSRTSHTYDEETALNVVDGIPAFLQEVIFLTEQLTERTNE